MRARVVEPTALSGRTTAAAAPRAHRWRASAPDEAGEQFAGQHLRSAGRTTRPRTIDPVRISSVSEEVPEAPDPEDVKIITLARAARARVAAAEGAAVRDETGRTYAAAAVALPSLQLSALHLAVAMAVSSGAASLEAAALVSDGAAPDPGDVAAVRELGPDAVVFHAAPDGTILATLRA